MSDFATPIDVKLLSGANYTEEDMLRVADLIPVISDALRCEAQKVGKDLDAMVEANSAYASVVKLVTVDVIVRAMRQATTGEPMSQESQSALGYSWSGTYAIPGGGISGAIMRNDLKRLGLRRQQIGVYELWDASKDET